MFRAVRLAGVVLSFFCGACMPGNPLVGGLRPPVITADPIVINRALPSTTLSATFTPPGALQTVTRIEVVLNRHRGTGRIQSAGRSALHRHHRPKRYRHRHHQPANGVLSSQRTRERTVVRRL